MAAAVSPSPIRRYEITEVYAHPEATVDIVLVHGLNGDPQKTWTARNGVFWPTALLPVSLRNAKVRILVYGYNADVYAFGGETHPSSKMIHEHAQTLITHLSSERLDGGYERNPIIWVAHSLGGILVKRALEASSVVTDQGSDLARSIFVATYGIVFLGTPHNGSDQAKMGMILQMMCSTLLPKAIIHTDEHLIQTLKANNETLQNINLHFNNIYERFKITFFYEDVMTELWKGRKDFIVDRSSAAPMLPHTTAVGVEANHHQICKFETRNSPGYLTVATTIRVWVSEAPQVIHARFQAEDKARQRLREEAAKEMLGIYTEASSTPQHSSANVTPVLTNSILSTVTIEPESNEVQFIKPHGFRPNSIFVGRETQLDDLHRLLFDKKRRNEGTSAVLLQCMPDGGKTHLAREYLYRHIEDYPGGIFWIRAKCQEEIEAGYWDIAAKVALKSTTDGAGTATARKDPAQSMAMARDWLNTHQDWLMVLDGIHFEHSEAFQSLIPDNPNTSLIYTSTESHVGGDYQFMNPHVMRIPSLSAREAQSLLLLELDRGEPSTADLQYAMELVQLMDFLPGAIHTVAKRLKATEEPLHRYLRAYAAAPKLRNMDAFKDVAEQLDKMGAFAALNLMKIVCFFNQHIPVGMISLGIKTLDVPLMAYEPGSGTSLNNTFKILNQFALIDRSEHNESLHSSQTSKASRELRLVDVDVVRLKGVVQDFFVDSLKAEGNLSLWLQRAIRVFTSSYKLAEILINSKTSAGFVADYRSYEIQGTRILRHVYRNEKKHPELKESHAILEKCLQEIKQEVDRRTRDSSEDITKGGKETAFTVSIFDERSSSSEAGGRTPSLLDRDSAKSSWSMDDKGHFESPVSVEDSTGLPHHLHEVDRPRFPDLSIFRDNEYDTDDESRTVHARAERRPADISQARHPDRRLLSKDEVTRHDQHRTVKELEKHRYHDSAGSWRSAIVNDPRVNRESALGTVQRPKTARSVSRGRWLSGSSPAEAQLRDLSRNSPSPARGGEAIRDRSQSAKRAFSMSDKGVHVNSTSPTSCAPLSHTGHDTTKPSNNPPLSLRSEQSMMPATQNSYSGQAPPRLYPDGTPMSPAMMSLQRISSPSVQPSVMPEPVAFAVAPAWPQPSYTGFFYDTYGRLYRGNMPLRPYTAQRPAFSPATYGPYASHKRDLPHDYSSFYSQDYPSMSIPPNQTGLSSEHDRMYEATPYPTNFDVDRDHLNLNHGYTSQPMSRDPSNQSATNTVGAARRPSLASEPDPRLPAFSPYIGPTSYQLYENTRLLDGDARGVSYGPIRKSPRLAFAQAAAGQIARQPIPPAEGTTSSALRPLNPNASTFLPRQHSQPPPLSSSPPSHHSAFVAPAMSPSSSSGGIRIGDRMIAFGDVEPVQDSSTSQQQQQQQIQQQRQKQEQNTLNDSLCDSPNANGQSPYNEGSRPRDYQALDGDGLAGADRGGHIPRGSDSSLTGTIPTFQRVGLGLGLELATAGARPSPVPSITPYPP